jgi:selenophosphate synthetase-related protein
MDYPEALVATLRANPGMRNKSPIALVREVFGAGDWLAGPGDDGAVIPGGEGSLVVGGEAILPAFVAGDPFGAGVAAVLANVNDLAAMGAVPLAIVDTIVADDDIARQALEGMRHASLLYDVPVVGGHLTRSAGPPALSASGWRASPKARCGPTSRSSPPSTSGATGWPATSAPWRQWLAQARAWRRRM